MVYSFKAENPEEYQVGTVLAGSWGYEQTNVEFYEIVKRTPKTVTIQKIASASCSTTGWASDTAEPVPGEYIGEPIKGKRIGPYGVKLYSFGCWLSPYEGKPMHRSWYA